MKKRLVTVLMLAAMLISYSATAQGIPWTGIVSTDTVQAMPGEQVKVAIRLSNNDLAIAGLEVPVKFDDTYLTLDSVSFAASFKPSAMSGVYFQENSRTVKITYIPDAFEIPLPTITATSGIIAELVFTVSPSAQPGFFPIDSVNRDTLIGSGVHLVTRINFADSTGTDTYLPEYNPGGIRILVPTAVDDEQGNSALPGDFSLAQNYPNPFNPTTTIQFAMPTAGQVQLEIFNVLGQKTTTLVNGWLSAGFHTVEFDAADFPSGIYFYRLTYSSGSLTRKMMLMK